MPERDNERVYLDWAATAPLYPEAREAMEPFLVPGLPNLAYGANANSLYGMGRQAFSALESAREALSCCLNANRPDEIIFTSGATEANNAAVWGIVSALRKKAVQAGKQDLIPHIITSAIEHDSVLAPLRSLKSYACEITYVKPDREGFIAPEQFEAALKENTIFASIQMANNEIGAIQSIQALASIAHDKGIIFHTDAVQALGKVAVDLKALGVDAASFSAHKVGGPKGCGLLYLKNKTPFEPFIVGGGQEQGKRSGTQNVCGAAGFSAAAQVASSQQSAEAQRLQLLRDHLYASCSQIEGVMPLVACEAGSNKYLPNVVSLAVKGLESETLILRLDLKGFEVSGGSACSSHSLEPSHVLRALGVSDDIAYGSLRISMGRFTTASDIDRFMQAFESCLRSS